MLQQIDIKVDNEDELQQVLKPDRLKRAHVEYGILKVKNQKVIDELRTNQLRFKLMLVLTCSFMLVELIVGVISNSLALIADALHMLSDLLALVVGYLSVKYSGHIKTETATYGFVRMEVLGALTNAVFMLSVCLFIFLEAIQRLILEFNSQNTELEDNAVLVLIVGAVGLGVNILGIFIFSVGGGNGGHGHSHGSGNGDAVEKKPNNSHGHSHGGNMNIQGVLIHVAGDALGSVAVIITGCVIAYTSWHYRSLIDPFCSMLVATIILAGTLPLLRKSFQILLQESPRDLILADVQIELETTSGVKGIHEFHVWQLSSEILVSSLHVVIDPKEDILHVLELIKYKLHDRGIHSSTIQPEIPCQSQGSYRHDSVDDCHDPVCQEDCLAKNCCAIDPEKGNQQKRDSDEEQKRNERKD